MVAMELTVVSRTDVGRVRTNNEDNFLSSPDLGLFIVCDGMGGHNAGEIASQMVCDIVQREVQSMAKLREKFLTSGKPVDAKALRKAVEAALSTACREIHRRAAKESEFAGMGTTVTMVLIAGHQKGILGHVGDSRLMVLRNGKIHQLSEDHTYVNELVKRGALSKEQAKNHPQGNVLSRAMGVQPSVAIDTMVFDIDPADTYLLCSDGLYNYFPNSDEMIPALQGDDLQQGLDKLINTSLERGGHDNSTGIVFRIGGKKPAAQAGLVADQRIAILKRIPLFAHLNYNELVKVLGLTQLAKAHAGDLILKEGDIGDEFYVVLAGEVVVEKGGNPITELGAGAHLGEMAMVDNAPRSATIRAKTDVNLLIMRRDEFFGLIRGEPVIASKLLWSFVQVLSGRLRQTNDALQGARQDRSKEATEEFEVFIDDES